VTQPKSVPEGWRTTRLGDIAKMVMGQSPPGSTVFDHDDESNRGHSLPFIQGTAEFGHHFPTPQKRCTQPLKTAKSGDCLISVRAPVGDTNLADQAIAIGRGLAAVRFDRADPSFGWYALNHAKVVLDRVAQGSTFEAIGRTELKTLPILLPPLGEQRAIAGVLDSVDEAIERAEEVVAATERLRDALLHELLTRGLPGQHSEWKEVPGLGTIPASWTVTRLGDIAEVVGGSTPSRTRTEYWGGDIPWVVPSELSQLASRYLSTSRESVTIEGLRVASLRVLPVGSVLLTTRATIGLVAINQVPVTTNQGFQCLIPNKDIYGLWLFYSISQKKQQLERRGAGSTFREVSRDGVRTLPIALPPLEEQRAIAEVLDSVDHSIERAREECDALRLAMKSISDALLTGRIRTNPQRERSYETAGTG